MCDSERLKAVRRRKAEEVVRFSSMIGIGDDSEPLAVVSDLCRDLKIIDCILATGVCAEPSEFIASGLYRDVLSVEDTMEEIWFDSMRIDPEYQDDPVPTILAELASCRARIEELSLQLDYARSEKEAAEMDYEEPLPSIVDEPDEPEPVEEPAEPPADAPADAPEEPAAPAVAEPEPVEWPAEPPAEAPAAEPAGPEEETRVTEASDDGLHVPLLFNDKGLLVLAAIRGMKVTKIDHFLDLCFAGKMDMQLCEKLVDHIKTDLQMLDVLLSIDYCSPESVDAGFQKVSQIDCDVPSRAVQDAYLRSLTPDEQVLEATYNESLGKVEEAMKDLFGYQFE